MPVVPSNFVAIFCKCSDIYIYIYLARHLRPTIAEAVREACPGRMVHVWQMMDPESPDAEVWLNLPILMQQHADRAYSQYQLQIYEASKRLERKEIKQAKYNAAVDNCIRPLILMHNTGMPATQRYVKEHLQQGPDGTMKLKANLLECSNVQLYRR